MKRLLLAIVFLCFFISVAHAGPTATSGTSASTIITNARYRLNAVSQSGVTDSYYSDAETLQWLNDGQIYIAERTHCLQDTETVYLTANTIETNFGSGTTLVRVWFVRYVDEDGDETPLAKGSLWGRTKDNSGQENPTHWYESNGGLGVYPPLAAISGTTPEYVQALFSYKPDTVSSTTSLVSLPFLLDESLTDYIVCAGLKKAEKIQLYATYRSTMEARLDFIANAYYFPAFVEGGPK